MTPAGFSLATYGFGFLAGLLSVLSPCVLPLLPIVLGSAVSTHRGGAVALSVGLAFSFVAIGLFVATIGFSLGLDGDLFRHVGAVFLLIFGLLMLLPSWQTRITDAMTRVLGMAIGDGWRQRMQLYRPKGVGGQLILGLLLGFIWTPCVGPTLGAAATLAAQRQNLAGVVMTMTIFGIGASLPLLAIGFSIDRLTRKDGAVQLSSGQPSFSQWRRAGSISGKIGRAVLGASLILIALTVLSGYDRVIETKLVDWSPAWLTALTTRF